MTGGKARVHVRAERPSDIQAIAQLNDGAFGGAYESERVGRPRADGLVAASLVARTGTAP